MPNRSSKNQKDHQELARTVLDAVVPDAEPESEALALALDFACE